MLEERTTVERWARSQIIRIEALRNSSKAMGRESYEEYLIPELLQPFYYFGGGWGPEQPPVVLRTSAFIGRAAFRDMMAKLRLLGSNTLETAHSREMNARKYREWPGNMAL